MRFDIFHHYRDSELTRKLDVLLSNQVILDRKVDRIMKTLEEFRQAIRDIDVETTRIAAKIEELTQKIKDGGLSDADEEAVFSEIKAHTERLKAVGKDPENPVPPVE
jgi:predicted transcriptional regulator